MAPRRGRSARTMRFSPTEQALQLTNTRSNGAADAGPSTAAAATGGGIGDGSGTVRGLGETVVAMATETNEPHTPSQSQSDDSTAGGHGDTTISKPSSEPRQSLLEDMVRSTPPTPSRPQLVGVSPAQGRDTVRYRSAPTLHNRQCYYVDTKYTEVNGHTVVSQKTYVECLRPTHEKKTDFGIILVHGDHQTGDVWATKPDDQPGWADCFLRLGYTVFLVDLPPHGRSNGVQAMTQELMFDMDFIRLVLPDATVVEKEMTAPGKNEVKGWPSAERHNKWPGTGTRDDPFFDRYMASLGPLHLSAAERQQAAQSALAALLDRIGKPCVLLGHGSGATAAWLAADARPNLVAGVVAVEPAGPPFARAYLDSPYGSRTYGPPFTYMLSHRRFGIADIPLKLDIDVDESLMPNMSPFTVMQTRGHTNKGDCMLQNTAVGWTMPEGEAGDRPQDGTVPGTNRPAPHVFQLVNLAMMPHVVVTAEASAHSTYDWATVDFLHQAGVPVEWMPLADKGIRGNGHLCFLETNSDAIAKQVSQWIQTNVAPESSLRRRGSTVSGFQRWAKPLSVLPGLEYESEPEEPVPERTGWAEGGVLGNLPLSEGGGLCLKLPPVDSSHRPSPPAERYVSMRELSLSYKDRITAALADEVVPTAEPNNTRPPSGGVGQTDARRTPFDRDPGSVFMGAESAQLEPGFKAIPASQILPPRNVAPTMVSRYGTSKDPNSPNYTPLGLLAGPRRPIPKHPWVLKMQESTAASNQQGVSQDEAGDGQDESGNHGQDEAGDGQDEPGNHEDEPGNHEDEPGNHGQDEPGNQGQAEPDSEQPPADGHLKEPTKAHLKEPTKGHAKKRKKAKVPAEPPVIVAATQTMDDSGSTEAWLAQWQLHAEQQTQTEKEKKRIARKARKANKSKAKEVQTAEDSVTPVQAQAAEPVVQPAQEPRPQQERVTQQTSSPSTLGASADQIGPEGSLLPPRPFQSPHGLPPRPNVVNHGERVSPAWGRPRMGLFMTGPRASPAYPQALSSSPGGSGSSSSSLLPSLHPFQGGHSPHQQVHNNRPSVGSHGVSSQFTPDGFMPIGQDSGSQGSRAGHMQLQQPNFLRLDMDSNPASLVYRPSSNGSRGDATNQRHNGGGSGLGGLDGSRKRKNSAGDVGGHSQQFNNVQTYRPQTRAYVSGAGGLGAAMNSQGLGMNGHGVAMNGHGGGLGGRGGGSNKRARGGGMGSSDRGGSSVVAPQLPQLPLLPIITTRVTRSAAAAGLGNSGTDANANSAGSSAVARGGAGRGRTKGKGKK